VKVHYKENIYDKLIDEINKNSKRIRYIEISISEYIELLDHLKEKDRLVNIEYINLVSSRTFNGIHLRVDINQ
jgi:coenzyme F420-reducing hydrogenase delta subunit